MDGAGGGGKRPLPRPKPRAKPKPRPRPKVKVEAEAASSSSSAAAPPPVSSTPAATSAAREDGRGGRGRGARGGRGRGRGGSGGFRGGGPRMPQADIPNELMPSTQLAEVDVNVGSRSAALRADGRQSAAQRGSLVQVGDLQGGLAAGADGDALDAVGGGARGGRQQQTLGGLQLSNNAMGMLTVEDDEGEVIVLDEDTGAKRDDDNLRERNWKGWHEIPSLYSTIPGRTVVTLPHVRPDIQRMDTSGVLRHFELREEFKASPASLQAVDEPRLCLMVQLPDLLPIPPELRVGHDGDRAGDQGAAGATGGRRAQDEDDAPTPPMKLEPGMDAGATRAGAGRKSRSGAAKGAAAAQPAPAAGADGATSKPAGLRNPFADVKSGKIGTLCIRKSGKAYIVGEDASATQLRVVPGFNVSCAEDLVLLRCKPPESDDKMQRKKNGAKGKKPRQDQRGAPDAMDDSDDSDGGLVDSDVESPARNEMIVLNGTKGRIKIVPNLEML